MSLSDCTKCWDTPCTCGWYYRLMSNNRLKNRIDLLNKVLKFKEDNPKAKYSDYGKETEDDQKFTRWMHDY
jgi:hypothetical protein